MASDGGWLRSARLISVCTLLSRFLGLLRDVLMAACFGAGVAMDAFVLAFMVPNLFRRLFGEGAMSAAFVPVLTRYLRKEGLHAATRFFRACFTALLVLLCAITAFVGVVCVVAPALLPLNPTWRLFFSLLPALFIFMPLICLTALLGAGLHVRRRFLGPALAPVILNVFWIAGMWIGASVFGVWSATFAILAGGVAQLVVLSWILSRHGMTPGLLWEPNHEGVRRTARLVGPMILGLAVPQINVIVDGLIAQLCVPGSGANSALYYGNRLVQFPIGVLGAALSTAIFPTLAAQAHEGDREGLLGTLRQGLRVAGFVALAATAIAVALAGPIVELLFQRDRFGPVASMRTAWTLRFYALGLAAYCANQIVTRVYYAREDAKTPVKVAVAMVALNFALNITLVWPLRESGLALATALTAFVNVAVLLVLLRGKIGDLGLDGVRGSLVRSGVAALACAMAASATLWAVAETPRLVRCLGPMAVGGLVFLAVARGMGMPELTETLGALRRRRKRGV